MLKRTLSDLANEARLRGVEEIDVDGLIEAMRQDPDVVVLDIREPDERAKGAIPGSVAIPRGVLERDIEKIVFQGQGTQVDLERTVICYCGGGSRSALAAWSLMEMGFVRVRSLAGGFKAWAQEGKPVSREP